MKYGMRYIELKTGYSGDGPAWIGKVLLSKSGRLVYFSNKAFMRANAISGNHIDVETGDEYWISGIKKNGSNRHWTGNGKIVIDKKMVNEYLELTGRKEVDGSYVIEDIPEMYPVERIRTFMNRKLNPSG